MYNFAIILLTKGIFGGAEKRFTQLFEYLSFKYPGKYYFIVTWDLYNRILGLFPKYPTENLIPIGTTTNSNKNHILDRNITKPYSIKHPSLIKQVYRFIKNYRVQRKYYTEIKKIRRKKILNAFLVFIME